MNQLASTMRDNWAAGAVDSTFQIGMSGSSTTDFANSVNGKVAFDWRNGSMRHVVLDGRSGPLRFSRFAGQFELRNGAVSIADSKMTSRGGTYMVSGTASSGRELGLNLHGGRSYTVSGPLNRPKVSQVAATRP
jgi:anti-sigma factor RsiW